jgi:TM2 domain-containing membrane protein YozV
MRHFKNKTVATLLAALAGTFGAHRFYLGDGRGWLPWLFPAYFVTVLGLSLRYLSSQHADLGSDFITFLHPVLLAAFLPTAVGFADALRYALTPDAVWDAHWNRASGRENHSGALVIVLAIFSLAIGTTGLLSFLAISVQLYFEGNL